MNDVVAVFRDREGRLVSCWPQELTGVPLEERSPPTIPQPYRGRAGIITHWPVATTGRMVVCGSLQRWRIAIALDFDSHIEAFSCEPVELRWRVGRRSLRWRPAFVARTRDGTRQILLPAYSGKPPAVHTERLRMLEEAADAAGWQVHHVQEPSGVRATNLQWAAGYRFPTISMDEERVLLRAFAQPVGVRRGAAASGLPELIALDLAYQLIWQQRVHIDWQQPLLPDALAWAA